MPATTCEKCQAAISPEQMGPASPEGMCPRCLMQMALDQPQEDTPTLDRESNEDLPPKPNQIAGLFPELEILDVIGQGGMGYVYKARQKNLGRIVAVKILSAKLADDPSFAERFAREARAMAMMNHPNIIAIYDFGCRENNYFLVMEYVDGLNLRQLVSTGEIKSSDAIALVPQLCDALQYAHDRGVVHRDIKPENVLVSQEGQVKIADFGLAKLTNLQQNLTLTQTRQIMGTPNYMAPEQREKPVDVDHRADIYSLGVVIYELLTGELPLGRFAPPSSKAEVDARIDELVMRALEKEPNLRFQKASELKTGIESLSMGVAPAAAGVAPVAMGMNQLQPGNAAALHAAGRGVSGSPADRSHASKVFSFVVMSLGILFGIGGILLVILSGIIEDIDDSFVDEGIVRIAGFVFMALCGVVFALYGIYSSVFHPKQTAEESQSKSVDGNAEERPKPVPILILHAIGTIMCFVCAAFFAIGSFIPGIPALQGGIGAALLAGCIFSVTDLIEKAIDPSRKDEDGMEELAALWGGNPECPRCGEELKSAKSKKCFACGYELE